MIGCEREIFPQVEPLLSVLGNNLFLAGDVGAGKTIKLINQMLVATHMAVLSQALALAAKTGIEPQKMYEIIRESSGHSRVMDLKMESFIVPQDFTPSFALKLMHKDLRLALDMAQATGVDSSVAQGAMQLFEEAMAGACQSWICRSLPGRRWPSSLNNTVPCNPFDSTIRDRPSMVIDFP